MDIKKRVHKNSLFDWVRAKPFLNSTLNSPKYKLKKTAQPSF